jgi:hypothetical protein
VAPLRAEDGHIKASVLKKLQLALQETKRNCRIHGHDQAGSFPVPIHLL